MTPSPSIRSLCKALRRYFSTDLLPTSPAYRDTPEYRRLMRARHAAWVQVAHYENRIFIPKGWLLRNDTHLDSTNCLTFEIWNTAIETEDKLQICISVIGDYASVFPKPHQDTGSRPKARDKVARELEARLAACGWVVLDSDLLATRLLDVALEYKDAASTRVVHCIFDEFIDEQKVLPKEALDDADLQPKLLKDCHRLLADN